MSGRVLTCTGDHRRAWNLPPRNKIQTFYGLFSIEIWPRKISGRKVPSNLQQILPPRPNRIEIGTFVNLIDSGKES